MDIDMDWPTVVLDWVNCLRLTENPITSVVELGDGKFLCEILHILFRKTVNIKNKAQVFHVLKESLKDHYTPSEWIDFEEGFDGNSEELIKILSVLVGVSSLQSEEKIFLENPSNHLCFETQVQLRKFLESVLENGKVVDSRFLENDKENAGNQFGKPVGHGKTMAPRVLSSPVLEAERLLMSEKNNEISTLKNRIDVLTACQKDLMEDINSYKEENTKLTQRCEDLEKDNQSFRVKANLSKNVFTMGSPKQPETPEKARNLTNRLKEKLKKSDDYVEQLETRIFDNETKMKTLQGELSILKESLHVALVRETELVKELEKDEEEKVNLKVVIQDRNERVQRLEQEIEDYRDEQLMNHSGNCNDHPDRLSGIFGLSNCDSFNLSTPKSYGQLSQCEDLASAVVEVQLRECQAQLQDTDANLEKSRIAIAELTDQLSSANIQLIDKETKIGTLESAVTEKEFSIAFPMESTILEKESNILSLEKNIASLKSVLVEKESNIESLKANIASLESAIIDNNIAKLMESNSASLKKNIPSLERKMAHKKSTIPPYVFKISITVSLLLLIYILIPSHAIFLAFDPVLERLRLDLPHTATRYGRLVHTKPAII